jgi:hypothetical protein
VDLVDPGQPLQKPEPVGFGDGHLRPRLSGDLVLIQAAPPYRPGRRANHAEERVGTVRRTSNAVNQIAILHRKIKAGPVWPLSARIHS